MPTTTEQFTSASGLITAEVFIPKAPRRRPAVLILHGTFGLLPRYRADIVSFAEALAARGIAAVIPHYFEGTGTVAGPGAIAAMFEHLPAWRATCGDALQYVRAHPRVDPARLGVIGFSLGGHLALGLGMSPPAGVAVKCAVDFFAPTLDPPLQGALSALPPVQIHHGTADTLVPPAHSAHLVHGLRAAGRSAGLGYEFHEYEGEGHGFTGAALGTSRTRTVAFLEAGL
jgi:carboxymethylenebutenolidase